MFYLKNIIINHCLDLHTKMPITECAKFCNSNSTTNNCLFKYHDTTDAKSLIKVCFISQNKFEFTCIIKYKLSFSVQLKYRYKSISQTYMTLKKMKRLILNIGAENNQKTQSYNVYVTYILVLD